jgi:hypothetical protein
MLHEREKVAETTGEKRAEAAGSDRGELFYLSVQLLAEEELRCDECRDISRDINKRMMMIRKLFYEQSCGRD